MILLVPGDPLVPYRPDEHFAREAEAAEVYGMDVQIIDHDALVAGRTAEAVRRVKLEGDAIYRGWMMRSEQYQLLADTLAGRNPSIAKLNVNLRTSPAQYRSAHELPGWYETFKDVTPLTFWTNRDLMSLPALLADLPRSAVVKDHVKSLKHHWDTAMFLPDTTDVAACRRVIQNFLVERGGDFVGHVVVRAFEDYIPGETRTWWINGEFAFATPHPDRLDGEFDAPDDFLDQIQPMVDALGNPFVTVDLARTVDGEHRVVEVGDGQVSDLPSCVQASVLYSILV